MTETFTPDTRPLWFDTASIPKHHQQTGEIVVDVCIVGGGITGLTTADLLKRAGKTVAVIDLGRVGHGETGHTTGHLTEVFDVDYRTLISNFGIEGATLAAQAARRSIERVEENAKRMGIDCELARVNAYKYTRDHDGVDALEAEAEAALKVGVPNELVFETPLPYGVARAIRFEHQAQFHPLKYLAGLASGIPGGGSYIFEDTRVLDVHDGEPCRVTTDRGTIVADEVVVAANVPVTNKFFLQTKIAAYRTYAIAVQVADRFDMNNLFWDDGDPYHYVRAVDFNGSTRLIIGGEDHKTGTDAHTGLHFQKLEDWAHSHFDVERITHHWSGQVINPVDGLPYIGRNSLSSHIFVATGFSGTGLSMGTVSGMLLSDLVLNVQNPWAELFDASRVKPLASLKNYISENIDFPSYLIGDRLTPAQKSEEAVIRENEGAIVRIGAKKVAAYRDQQGELHLMSPVCPHMGCYVHWNEAEKSWDCPCHGSRFNPVGKLLNGPAVADLAPEEHDENAPMIPERYDQPNPGSPNPFSPSPLSVFSCPFKPGTT